MQTVTGAQTFSTGQINRPTATSPTDPVATQEQQAEEAEEKRKGIDYAALLETLQKMNENVRAGRPADYDREEERRTPGFNEFAKNKEKEEDQPREDTGAGMNRIRSTLQAMGFKPQDIDAYLNAMKMPDLQGDSGDEMARQLDQHEEEQQAQRREQQLESRLSEPQQASATMMGGIASRDGENADQLGAGGGFTTQQGAETETGRLPDLFRNELQTMLSLLR